MDKNCFQHGLDSDRKHASIAHHRAVRESLSLLEAASLNQLEAALNQLEGASLNLLLQTPP